MDDDDLVQTTVDGISFAWEDFLVVVSGHEVQPNFEILCTIACRKKEEFEKEMVPLRKRILLSLQTQRREKERGSPVRRTRAKVILKDLKFDMSKIKCYNCNKMGHYAKDRFNKKLGRFHASTTEANGEP